MSLVEQVCSSWGDDPSCKVDMVDLLQDTCICSSTQVKSKAKFCHCMLNLLDGGKFSPFKERQS